MSTESIPRESWPGYGSKGKESWQAVSRREPCPICGKPDNCKVNLDKTAVWCGRVEVGSVKQNAGGQYLHRLGDRPPGYTHPRHFKKTQPKPSPTKDWPAIAKQLHAAGCDRLGELAAELGVGRRGLELLGVGRGEIDFRDGWSFPERDDAGRVIGINHRLTKPMVRGGKPTPKIQGKGGSRGLTYADNWHAVGGDVYLVEGGSDTAALMTMGLCVIGRPSNVGGVKLLAELLKSHPGRRIVVIGENDKKTITEYGKQVERWPGRAGAISTATILAELLGRPVSWSLVPARYKDSRELLKAEKENARDVFLAGLVLNTVEPPPPVEKYTENTEQIKPLQSWRREMAAARINSIRKPGIYLDRSPTGAGKTHADAEAIAKVKTSLTMLPTHAQCNELADELKNKHGIDAAVYPNLDEATCKNIDEAQQAQDHGLIVGASVCPRCLFREDCEYQRLKKSAEDSPHVIATQCRGSVSMENLAKGKELISIHEDARNLLRPMAQCGESYLKSVEQIARTAKAISMSGKKPDVDAYQFFDDLETTATKLLNLIESTTETTEVSRTPPKRNTTKEWQAIAWKAIRQCDNLKPVGESLEIIAAYMRVELVSLTIRVDKPRGAGGVVQTKKSLVAVWKTDLPKRSPMWIGDATANAVEMGTLIGRPVEDCTPTGRLESQVPPVQVSQDITRGMKTETVAAMLRGAMSLPEHRDKQRIGMIGHKPHIEALLRKRSPLLDDATRDRVTKAVHFGEGPERASNDWHKNCDLIVVLGTPRVPPAAVVDELIRQGKMDAARRDGRWECYRWETKNTAGQVVQIEGSRYADEDWHAAHRSLVYATIVQAVGRGRGNLADGVPVVLFSNEQTGFTVMDAGQMQKISREVTAAVEAIRKLGNGISTAAVAAELGVGGRWGLELLTKAEEAGQVYRRAKRWYRVPEVNAKDITLADNSGTTPASPLVDQAQVEEAVEAVVTIRKDSAHNLHTKAAALAARVPGVVLACNLSPPRKRAAGYRGGVLTLMSCLKKGLNAKNGKK